MINYIVLSGRVFQIHKCLQVMGDPSRCLPVIDLLIRILILQRYHNSKLIISKINNYSASIWHSSFVSSPIVNSNFNSGQQVSVAARLSPHSPAGILSFSHPQPLSPRVTQVRFKSHLIRQGVLNACCVVSFVFLSFVFILSRGARARRFLE